MVGVCIAVLSRAIRCNLSDRSHIPDIESDEQAEEFAQWMADLCGKLRRLAVDGRPVNKPPPAVGAAGDAADAADVGDEDPPANFVPSVKAAYHASAARASAILLARQLEEAN